MRKRVHYIVYLLFALLIVLTSVINGCINIDNSINRDSGSLNLLDIEPVTLDPAISGESNSHLYIRELFSGLVKLDDNLHIQPDIADSWTISNDGRVYLFTLKKNVTFHNGKEVTAQDFKYSWERACNPGTGSETASIYLNDIVGAYDVLNGTASEIKGVEVLDKYTLKVTIDKAKAYFLSKMTYQTSYVVDRDNVASGSQWWKKPNGTGPFKLKEWQPGTLIILEAYDKYYGNIAKLDKINFHILAGYPMELYELNEIDIAPVSQIYIDKAEDPEGGFKQDLHMYPQLTLTYVGFNTTTPPFDDINVRQAFCHAVNKEKIINVILRNTVTNANSIVPPGMPGYNSDLKYLDYDIEKARKLIADSKYGNIKNLPPIVLTLSGYGGNIYQEIGAIIQDWKDNLGIQVTVRQIDPDIFSYHLQGEVDNIYAFAWIADYPDPQNFLDTLFSTGSSYNLSKYSNEKVDTLLEQAGVETDETKRLSLYREAEQIILRDAPCLPLWNERSYVLIKPYVKDYYLNPQGEPTLNKAYIEH